MVATKETAQPHPTLRSQNGYSGSLAERIRGVCRQNPYLSTKQVCQKLCIDYQKYKQYVRNQKSHLRRNSGNKLQHDSHRNIYVWNLSQLDILKNKIQNSIKRFGWNFKAKNRLLYFRHDELGSILWHNTNRIELFLKGRRHIARVKTLFYKAFFQDNIIPDIREVERIFRRGRIERRHHTFRVGKKVPRLHIDYFKKSHGLTFLSDGSHEESVEVIENRPFWLYDLQSIVADFKADMAKHMQLLDGMNKLQRRLEKRVGESLLKRVQNFLRGL